MLWGAVSECHGDHFCEIRVWLVGIVGGARAANRVIMWRWRAGRRAGRGLGLSLRRLHNGPDTLEELVERHVVKEAKGQRLPSAGLTTSRREALALYREILRTTRLFTWTNEQGVPW